MAFKEDRPSLSGVGSETEELCPCGAARCFGGVDLKTGLSVVNSKVYLVLGV